MKELAYSLSVTLVVVLILLTASYEAGAADGQTPDHNMNNVGNERILVTQNAAPSKEKSDHIAANVDGKGVMLKGYDAVAYLKQGRALKGNPAIESTYKGVTYLFASVANKADFDKDPAKYVPQYGGFCAYGVANGVLSYTEDPNAPPFPRASFTSVEIRMRSKASGAISTRISKRQMRTGGS
jgi:YHS domain-containing protein